MTEIEVNISAGKVLLDPSAGRWLLPISINGIKRELLDVTECVSDRVAVVHEESRIVIQLKEVA